MRIGTPLSPTATRVMLLGAGELGKEVIIAHHDTVIESEDHVILFLVDKNRIDEVERLFQVGITFL